MKYLMASLRATFLAAAVVSLLALPGAVYGFGACPGDCPECRETPSGCFEFSGCIGDDICVWNGDPCEDEDKCEEAGGN